NRFCRWLVVTEYPQQLDTLTIDVNSVTFVGPRKDQFKFDYNYYTHEFRLTEFPKPMYQIVDTLGTMEQLRDSVLVCYRVLPLSPAKPAFRRDIRNLDRSAFQKDFYKEDFAQREEIFKTPGLKKTG